MTDTPPRGTPKHDAPEPSEDDESGARGVPASAGPGRGGAHGGKGAPADFYRLLVESVQDYAIFALDPTGRVLTWSAGAARLKGYARTEIIGRHFSTFYPPEDVAAGKPDRELQVATRTGRLEDEGWRVRKDGTRFWASVVITALRDELGALVGFAKVTRDLTERRAAEEQARRLAAEEAAHAEAERRTGELRQLTEQLQNQAIELEQQTEEAQSLAEELEQANVELRAAVAEAEASRQRAAAVTDAALDCVVAIDHAGRITEFNAAAEQTFGYARAEVLGRELADTIVPPALREAHRRGLARYVATGEAHVLGRRVELSARRKDGTEFPVELAITRIRVPGPAAFTAHLRDVTERARRETEQRVLAEAGALLASSLAVRQRLETLAQVAVRHLADGCAIHLVRPDGTTELAAVASTDPHKARVVEELERRFPLPADAPHGYPNVIRTGQPQLLAALGEEVLAALGQGDTQLALLRELDMHSGVVVPLSAHGRTFGALTLVGHGPERTRRFGEADLPFLEELARRAALAIDNARLYEEATAANQAKTDFLAVMSHELRTPLNAIAGYAELLELGIHGPLTAQQREAISRIQRSQRHLLGLINDVLNYAKLEAGRVEYTLADVSVRDALDAIEPLVAPQLRAKGLRFTREGCGAVRAVRADPDKLQQILVNLLSNAIKFTAAGGAVTMRCEDRGGAVCIRVRDTGIGIAADRLEQVFAPFVQIDRRLNAPHEGTGLGLAISRDLARGMGGDLTAESTPGAGSTFTLTLPRA